LDQQAAFHRFHVGAKACEIVDSRLSLRVSWDGEDMHIDML
jgi:hypothetical protein